MAEKKRAAKKIRPVPSEGAVSSQYVRVGNSCVRISIHVKAKCRDGKPGRTPARSMAVRSSDKSSGMEPMSSDGPPGSSGGGGGVEPLVSIDITVEANDP